MICPRCRNPATQVRLAKSGGAYRDAMTAAFRCEVCDVTILDRSSNERMVESLSRSMLLRTRKDAEERCPKCQDRMSLLTLSWSESWVEVEECSDCHIVVFDPNELTRLRNMSDAAEKVDAAIRAAIADSDPDEEAVEASLDFYDPFAGLVRRIEDFFSVY